MVSQVCGYKVRLMVISSFLLALASAMGSLGTIAARTATTGLLRSTPPVMRGTWASTLEVSTRRAATTGSSGSLFARFSNIVLPDRTTREGVCHKAATAATGHTPSIFLIKIKHSIKTIIFASYWYDRPNETLATIQITKLFGKVS